jgi:uncharacterized membrane protein YphA (DoxX/SURF4 family)
MASVACFVSLSFATWAGLKLLKTSKSNDLQSSLQVHSIELSLLISEYAVLSILASMMVYVGARAYQLSFALSLENSHSTTSIIAILSEIGRYIKVSLCVGALLIAITGAMRIVISRRRGL